MRVELHAKDWLKLGVHHWRGYAWLDDELWTPLDYQGEDLTTFLPRLNGCFSWVGEHEDVQFAACDRLGSYPLFYGKGLITDRLSRAQLDINPYWLKAKMWHYVEALPGCRTLDDDFLSIPPFSYLTCLGGVEEVIKLQSSSAVKEQQASGLDFEQNILAICRRLIRYADGKAIVVLLSDGYDSRLLLAALKRLDYPHLKAATYGIRGNEVVEKAEEIARRMEIPWFFIDYSDPKHASFMTEKYPELVEWCANGQSVPQEQEIFAAFELRKLLPEGGILVPGISGDLQAGSYVPPYSFRWSANRSATALLRWLRTRLTRLPVGAEVTKAWEREIAMQDHRDSERSAVLATEQIIVQERLNKYLCTTLRAYEMAGFDWYLPQWDREFLLFWEQQPISLRRYRAAYRTWCKTYFFIPQKIHFAGEGEKPRIHLGRLIKRFLPFGHQLAGGVPDPNEFSKTIAPLIGKEVAPTEVNAALGDWLIGYYEG